MRALESFFLVLASIAATALAWGVYGPVLHWGQAGMGGGRMRPLICVGISYFAIAIVVPMILLYVLNWEADEKFSWNSSGIFWSLMGGVAGAVGALGIIMALSFGGKPIYVMPLVFGCAPVVNTIFTLYMNYRKDPSAAPEVSPFFAAGLILVAVGAATVLFFQPKSPAHAAGHDKKIEKPKVPAEKKPKSLKPPAKVEPAPPTESVPEKETPEKEPDSAPAAESPPEVKSAPSEEKPVEAQP